MTGLALWHRGVPAAQVELNDGGVWVTNQSRSLVGHLNYPSRTLDGGVRALSGAFDVSQSANTVVMHDDGQSRAVNVNTANMTIGDGAPVEGGVALTQGGQVAAAADPKSGKVWVLPADSVDTFRVDADPLLADLVGVRAIVGTDGVVHTITPDGSTKRIVDGKPSDSGLIPGITDLAMASLTVVGDQLVVLDVAGSTIRTTKGTVSVDRPDKLVLQQPGPANDRVLVAGPATYLWVPLGGGSATVLPVSAGTGVPVAPAVLESCGYLAWMGSGAYVRDCVNDADDRTQTVEKLKSFTQAAFRVNRDVIVLNDVVNGTVLLVNDNMRQVDNWQAIDSATQKEEEDTESTDTTDELTQADKKQQNTKPIAKDDSYGVRPGRTVTLPVLQNDSDADGDLLTASVKTQPSGATVSQLRGGEALSIAVPRSATGTLTFPYVADDGRNGTDTATVLIKVVPDGVEEAPVQTRTTTMTVAQRGEATYSLLGDFRDPESDTIYLAGVDQPPGLSVKWRPDGVVTVKDLGTGGVGLKDIHVQVSDGTKTGSGLLRVNVREGRIAPIANTDHVTVLKGQNIVVRPLANDVDPLGGQLRLTDVQEAGAGQTIQPDYTGGTFQFSATTIGTTYVKYQIANNSPKPSVGYVRIDVAEPAPGKPVPGDDLAMLPDAGSVLVDALANDTDPAGGVLVLKSVNVPTDSGIAVEILEHNVLRVSAPAGLTKATDFTYVVSNGPGEATGRVTVVPLPASSNATPPNATDDRALVREGDIVTVRVLDNDQSPSGLPLSIDPKVVIDGNADAGDVFAAGDTVRFRAKKSGTTRVNYTVRDTAGNFATAQLILTVVPLEQPNSPPVPQPVTGRVLAGSTVTLRIPTDGIDPDGDSVTLLGIGSAPTIGTATMVKGAIEYSAPAKASGTDSFTYRVADRFSVPAVGTIRIGIAPPNTTNQSPVAVPDDVTTRPGRVLAIDPTRNDVDPDGDRLSLVDGSVEAVDSTTKTPAMTDGHLVELTTPAEEGILRYYYGVSDGHAGSVKGVLTVQVSKSAPLQPPVALDDPVLIRSGPTAGPSSTSWPTTTTRTDR